MNKKLTFSEDVLPPLKVDQVHWTRPFNIRNKLLESMRHYHKSITPNGWLCVWKFSGEFIEVVW